MANQFTFQFLEVQIYVYHLLINLIVTSRWMQHKRANQVSDVQKKPDLFPINLKPQQVTVEGC